MDSSAEDKKTVDRTFDEIWEKDAKWLSGPQILSMIVDDFRGKSLIATIDKNDPSTISIGLPLPTIETPHGSRVYKATLMIPDELRSVFQQCLDEILLNNEPRIKVCTDRYIGMRVDERIIAQINEDFRAMERDNEAMGAQTLVDMAERAFGLPNRFADIYREAKSNLAAFRKDRSLIDPRSRRRFR